MATTSSPTRLSRRALIGGIPAVALILAGCSATASSTSTATATSTAAAAAGSASPAATGSVAALAQAFQATLTSDQRTTLLQDYTLANAERWSNLPQALVGGMGGGPGNSSSSSSSDSSRLGVSIADLDDGQLTAFNALLAAATGSGAGTGYDEIQQHLNADDYLAENGGGDAYGRSQFFVAFLGAPGDSGTWEFQFGGHHLAVANTYIDGSLVGATPSFRGIEPNGAFDDDGITNQPMAVKEAAFTALLAGLDSTQLAAAKLSKTYSDLVLAPGKEWSFPTTSEGVQVSTFTDAQKTLALAAIAGYVNDIADADAATILARYEAELDDTYIAYSGTAALTERNDYVRIDGPSVWIEFSMQNGIVLSGNHPHSVWRDRSTDYGGTQA